MIGVVKKSKSDDIAVNRASTRGKFCAFLSLGINLDIDLIVAPEVDKTSIPAKLRR